MDSSGNFSAKLGTRVISAPKPYRAKVLRIPGLGRMIFTRDPGDSTILSSEVLASHVQAVHRDGDGQLVHEYDLGSGLVTNVGVLSLANDPAWLWTGGAGTGPSTLGCQNWHATGTGTTAAAATDIALQTLASPTTTAAVAGVQSLVSAANSQVYKTVATINYTTPLAITEWGLHSLQTLTSATGSPFTATTASSWTDTGSAQTASSSTVRGLQQTVVVPGTTTVYGLNLSNTTHIGTIVTNGWYTVAGGLAGSTPGATEAFAIKPVLWDHKVFSAINVVNGDSIQFSYSLTINSGG